MLNNFIDILAAPNQVFTRLKEKSSWFTPWIVVALVVASIQMGFFYLVDTEFLLDQLVEQTIQPGVSENDLRVTLQAQVENKNIPAVSSSVGVIIGLLLIYAISAGYLYMVSKLTDNEITFKSWYSLIAWCSVPSIFTAIAAWIVILSSGGLIELEALTPLNLNYLIFRSEDDFSGFLSAFDLINIWIVVLTVLGYKSFTSCSSLQASAVVLSPYILILGIWALSIAL
ncbi:YIP1 family protein [Gammaproteobacteria bacterium]|nr:YIP1 family protein [Gammaproteobacteria bacterium]